MTTLSPPDIATQTARRWVVAAAAVLTHLCLGSVYAWSVFVLPLGQQLGWDKPAVTWAFSTAIACLGLTAAFGAGAMRRMGPRKSVMLSGILVGIGYAGAALACKFSSLPLLYLGFGMIGGIGLGLGYTPPVTTLLRWFPDRRGLATGMAVSGFGLGALVASQIAEHVLPSLTCQGVFWLFACIYAPVILIASAIMWPPPETRRSDWPATPTNQPAIADTQRSWLRTSGFWLIWSVFFINICAGIMLIALAKPMASQTDLTLSQIAWVVPLMGVFNGTGRLAWSAASDRMGRMRTIGFMLLIQIGLFLAMASTGSGLLFFAALLIIVSCYGGGFALVPALIADRFGAARGPAVYGAALTAWSAAAVCSPPAAAYLQRLTGTYTAVLYGGSGLLVVGTALAFVLSRSNSAMPRPDRIPAKSSC